MWRPVHHPGRDISARQPLTKPLISRDACRPLRRSVLRLVGHAGAATRAKFRRYDGLRAILPNGEAIIAGVFTQGERIPEDTGLLSAVGTLIAKQLRPKCQRRKAAYASSGRKLNRHQDAFQAEASLKKSGGPIWPPFSTISRSSSCSAVLWARQRGAPSTSGAR